MLKIRGKLVLSFGIVMIILLSALGSITYYTFKDSISYSKEYSSKLSLKNHRLALDNVLNTLLLDMQLMTEKINIEKQSLEKFTFSKILSEHEIARVMIDDAVVFENDSRLYGVDTQSAHELGLRHAVIEGAPQSFANLYLLDNAVWMRSEMRFSDTKTIRLFARLNIEMLWQLVFSGNSREADSLIFVASGEELLFSHLEQSLSTSNKSNRNFTALLKQPARLNSIVQTLTNNDENVVLLDGNYVVASSLGVMDWYIYSLQSADDYLADIIKLKNRIIAATLITLWFSIWIVLIVAHKIAKPISLLATATRSIQSANYSAPLIFKKTNDEIGDLASSFENMRKHIEKLIFTDTLTAIFNRRYLLRMMELEVSKSIREDLPLAFIMIDLDHFKAVNDTYGHVAGDEVLKAAAAALASAVRDYDIPARYGGEEFCVILPSTELKDALMAAERIRLEVASLSIQHDGQSISVSCSLGVAQLQTVNAYQSRSSEDVMKSLMSNADEALYLAKENGRNCSYVFSSEDTETQLRCAQE